MQSQESSNITLSDPLPTGKHIVCWDRCAPCCTSLELVLQTVSCNEWVSQAASGVTSSYDTLVDLFECLGNFLKRLEIYTTIPPTPIMTDIIIKVMVQLLSVLALATKQIKQGRFSECAITYKLPVAQRATEKFAKKLLGDSEIEKVLQRLDRLTEDEARMTVSQTLCVVHGLVGNMKVVMEGVERLLVYSQIFSEDLSR